MIAALRNRMQEKRMAPIRRAFAHRLSTMADLPEVRVAVAGAGKFAFRHLETLSAMPNVRVVGICNRSGQGLEELCSKFGIERGFAGLDAMLNESKPDVVWVVVGHQHTATTSEACLERGIPCLIEKPAAFTSNETECLAQLAEQSGTVHMVGVNRRFLSTVQAGLAEVLRRGPLLGIEVNAPEAIRRLRNQGVDANLADQWLVANTIHAIDLIRCVGGEVSEFAGFRNATEEAAGDGFAISMRMQNGTLATFTSHWHSVPGWSMRLYGEGARVDLNLETGGEVVDSRLRKAPISPDACDIVHKPGLFAQNEMLIRCVAEGTKPVWPASTLADQVGTMRLIEQIGAAA